MINKISNFNSFEDFDLFDRAINCWFNTPGTKDIHPASWKKLEDGRYCAVCRTVGIKPEDVSVKITGKNIVIDGKTVAEDNAYSCHVELPISEFVKNNLIGIDYKTENGLTYIYLKVKTEVKSEIPVKRII